MHALENNHSCDEHYGHGIIQKAKYWQCIRNRAFFELRIAIFSPSGLEEVRIFVIHACGTRDARPRKLEHSFLVCASSVAIHFEIWSQIFLL